MWQGLAFVMLASVLVPARSDTGVRKVHLTMDRGNNFLN